MTQSQVWSLCLPNPSFLSELLNKSGSFWRSHCAISFNSLRHFSGFSLYVSTTIGSSLNPAQWISMKFRLWQYQTPALGECNTANAWTKKQISEQQEYPNNREILGMSFVSCRPKSFSELFFSFGVTFHHSGCLVFGGPCCFSHSYCHSLRYRYGMLHHLLERYYYVGKKKYPNVCWKMWVGPYQLQMEL